MRACPKHGKGFGMLSNMNEHEEMLNTPKTHVRHGFRGMKERGDTSKKQIVVHFKEIEYN